MRAGLARKRKGIVVAKRLKSIVGRSMRVTLALIGSLCPGRDGIFRSRSLRVRIPRKTIPGSNPSTNVALAATLTSLIAKGTIDPSCTVANRISLHKNVLPVNKLPRGLVTTRETNVAGMLVPFSGTSSLRSMTTRMGSGLGVAPIGGIDSILGLLLKWGIAYHWARIGDGDP